VISSRSVHIEYSLLSVDWKTKNNLDTRSYLSNIQQLAAPAMLFYIHIGYPQKQCKLQLLETPLFNDTGQTQYFLECVLCLGDSCSPNTNVCNNTFLACRLIISVLACFAVVLLVCDQASSSTLKHMFVGAFFSE